jgi:Taurine catabolism dioxygenase TauD, TfdA family
MFFLSPPSSSSFALPEIVRQPGRPAVLPVDVAGDAAGWLHGYAGALRAAVIEHGALLVRGLGLTEVADVQAAFAKLSGDAGLMIEREAFAPRTGHAPGVYSSTKWPANQPMCMHHELSYTMQVPGLMLFACRQAPAEGGATAVANATAVLDALPGELVDRFASDGWLLTRNYNDEIGASYADAFGTDDPAAVADYCRANAIECEWQADGGLRTRQRRAAVVTHPSTRRPCWFNQIAFLNEWTMDPEVREFLVDVYGPDGLPFNTSFGNGEPITEDIVALINSIYDAHTVREPWQAGDLMLVDNIATAHSREPFTGQREVLVALTDPTWPTGRAGSGEGGLR